MSFSQVLQMLLMIFVEKAGPYLTKLIEQLFARIFPNAQNLNIEAGSFADFVTAVTAQLRAAANRMRFPFNRLINWAIDNAIAELWNRLISAKVIMGEAQPVLMQAGPHDFDFTHEEIECCLCELPAKPVAAVFHT